MARGSAGERTFAAVRACRRANLLSESHKEAVGLCPEFSAEEKAKRHFTFLRSGGGYQPQAIEYPMDVGVHANRRNAVANAEYQICRFDSDSGQRKELVQRSRDFAAVLIEKLGARPFEVRGLCPVEAGRKDKFGNCDFVERGELRSGAGTLKESAGSLERDRILGPKGDHRRNKDKIRITVFAGNTINGCE